MKCVLARVMALLVLAFYILPAPAAAFAQSVSHAKALPVVRPVQGCAALKGTALQAIGGTGSRVATASEAKSGGIAVCAVEVELPPAIHIKILLPLASWQQRYLQVGCGGLCGNIMLQSGASNGCKVLAGGGFVMAGTDMGHTGQDADWGNDPQKRIDFAYRAEHLTALVSKALIRAFYGQAEKFAYFNGCSDGGREALMEAQRYPDDFDGIIAGAPAMLFQVQNTLYHGWQARSNTAADGSVILTSDRLPILHKAVVQACDALDGVTDGLIAQPALCRFDPRSIVCPAGSTDSTACLTTAEAEVARRFYDGPRDAATGLPLTAGQPLPGSELNWQGVYVADDAHGRFMSGSAALPVLQMLAFAVARPDFALADLRFDVATLDALRTRHPLFDATNTNLDAFAKAGRKLILWHGLADPHIAPANTLAYHKGLIERFGPERVSGFERLYLLPGVSHCAGGEGPGNLDLLTAMIDWVEGDAAPDGIVATTAGERVAFGMPEFGVGRLGQGPGPGAGPGPGGPRGMGPPPMPSNAGALPKMTRPVYPYPYVARYVGSGDVNDGANWTKGNPAEIVALRPWPGQDLFGAYAPSAD